MRLAGAVTDLQGLGRHDHVCWVYGEPREFSMAARRFLLDGLERGERLLCVGDAAIRSATEGESALPDAAELVRSGRLDLLRLPDVHANAPRALTEQLQFYSRAVEQALADGYAGLRVAAEVTDLAAGSGRRDAHVEWEQVADRFIASGPGMATLCAYRLDVVDDALLARLQEVHPLTGGVAPAGGFRLFFDGDVLVLRGEVDAFAAKRLAQLLRSVPVPAAGVVLDVGPLEFCDAAGACALADWGRGLAADGMELRLRNARRCLRRVWDVLDLTGAAVFVD